MSLLPYLLPALQLDVLLNSIYLSSFFSKSFSGASKYVQGTGFFC